MICNIFALYLLLITTPQVLLVLLPYRLLEIHNIHNSYQYIYDLNTIRYNSINMSYDHYEINSYIIYKILNVELNLTQ